MDVRKLAVLALALIGTVGCAIEEEDFPDAYADAVCDKLQRCDRGDYESTYEDKDECEAAWADSAEWVIDAGEFVGMEYSPELGRECIDGIRSASCAEFEDGEYTCEVFE